MDFDISTLLYIGFAVAYYLFFSDKKKQKKKRPARPIEERQEMEQSSSERSRPTFEELLEEFTGAKAFEEKKELKPIPVAVVEEKPREEKKSYVRSVERTSHLSIDSEFARFEEFDDETGNSMILDDLNDPDSARKAFIYSEIFKRKY